MSAPVGISRGEYDERWTRVHAALDEAELDGVVIWSRGGATVDAYADVYYLSNHYSQFPLIGDLPPYWAGRSHAALVAATGGAPTLVVDLPDWRRDLVAVDDVRFGLDLPAAVAYALAERGLEDGRIGLVGGNALLVSPYRALLAAVPAVRFEPVDDLVERLRARKSPAELELLRRAASVGNAVVAAIVEAALEPGTREAEAVAAGYAVAVAAGAATYDAAVASGPHSDFYAFGRLPSWTTRQLERGDLFHVDVYGAVDGYLYDLARSCVVGAEPTAAQTDVLEGVIAAVEAGVGALRPGAAASDVFEAVQNVLEERALVGDAALGTSFPSHGHSLGLGWERPWIMRGENARIEAGMCVCVEAMGGRAGVGSACFEHAAIVGAEAADVLTTAPSRFW